ncbi:MAG: hypothetical protein K1X38_18465 [Microthrixaceae bacterium]|nr:hypothetical protein [Microthrixaceae bacterium]
MILRKAVAPCLLALVALPLAGCPTEPSGPPATTSTTTSTTSTTTTTEAPLPTLTYNGTAERAAGCFSGAFGTTNAFANVLGADGWWNFYFQGCNLGSTETVALHEAGSGSPVGNEFQSPTGYKCRLSIDGGSDATPYYTNDIGIADTGGLIFLSSSYDWPDGDVSWTVTCIDVDTPV